MVKYIWFKMTNLPFAALHGDPDILCDGKTKIWTNSISSFSA